MILTTYTKQPAEVLDYDIDFSSWLGATGTIVSHTATISPSTAGGATIVESSIMAGAKAVKVIIGGGTHGTKYKITVRVTTASIPALVKEAEFGLAVKDF